MPKLLDILLVEDDGDDIELFENALRDNLAEYKLSTLMQGDKVIPWLKTRESLPHVIVLDLNIPKIHGKDLLGKIRENARYSAIPIVVLSTSSSQKEKEFCLENGANAFVTKPTTLLGFNETIRLIKEAPNKKTILNS
jgi:DNA-binding response OmpR family regulator